MRKNPVLEVSDGPPSNLHTSGSPPGRLRSAVLGPLAAPALQSDGTGFGSGAICGVGGFIPAWTCSLPLPLSRTAHAEGCTKGRIMDTHMSGCDSEGDLRKQLVKYSRWLSR